MCGRCWALTKKRRESGIWRRAEGLAKPPARFHGARPPDDSYESVWQVRLSNHKPTEVVVRVHDQLPLNGEVSEETQPHETINPRHVVWPVTVAAGGEAVLTYKVRKSP